MKSDLIEKFGKSMIQHGKINDRAYLMKIEETDSAKIVDFAVSLAKTKGYSKIFAKSPSCARSIFIDNGFVEEARIPQLFQGREDIFFLSKFFSAERKKEKHPELVTQVLKKAEESVTPSVQADLPPGFSSQKMGKFDVEEMAQLYRQIFASYPFPIHDPDYLSRTMDDNVIYFGIRANDKLMALSSTEIDFVGQNTEMTDFATIPEARGLRLATFLLSEMEKESRQIGIKTAYTIARAYSFGINITFARHGYTFAGSLLNNTQISGELQSMNVWHKRL